MKKTIEALLAWLQSKNCQEVVRFCGRSIHLKELWGLRKDGGYTILAENLNRGIRLGPESSKFWLVGHSHKSKWVQEKVFLVLVDKTTNYDENDGFLMLESRVPFCTLPELDDDVLERIEKVIEKVGLCLGDIIDSVQIFVATQSAGYLANSARCHKTILALCTTTSDEQATE